MHSHCEHIYHEEHHDHHQHKFFHNHKTKKMKLSNCTHAHDEIVDDLSLCDNFHQNPCVNDTNTSQTDLNGNISKVLVYSDKLKHKCCHDDEKQIGNHSDYPISSKLHKANPQIYLAPKLVELNNMKIEEKEFSFKNHELIAKDEIPVRRKITPKSNVLFMSRFHI